MKTKNQNFAKNVDLYTRSTCTRVYIVHLELIYLPLGQTKLICWGMDPTDPHFSQI